VVVQVQVNQVLVHKAVNNNHHNQNVHQRNQVVNQVVNPN